MKRLTALLLATMQMMWPLNVQAEGRAENIVLITIDGLRWQEVFRGVDKRLATHEEYTAWSDTIMERFWEESPEKRADKLFPFLRGTVFRDGTAVGNRDADSCARVANPWYFSYPGYNEILTGQVDESIDSNAAVPNPNRTFLELLNGKPDYRGKIAAFASWNVFPAIINSERSGIHVNADPAMPPQHESEEFLARLQADVPSPWDTVRLDAFTHHFAKSYLQRHKPRVLYIAYGEPDDFAHDGKYDQHILAAHRVDRFIGEIWETVNSIPEYRGNTALFITVDHGRGEEPLETWQHHASKRAVSGYVKSLAHYKEGIAGSEAIWMAAMGPGVPSAGLLKTGSDCLTADRIAATLLALLGENYREFDAEMGAPLEAFLK